MLLPVRDALSSLPACLDSLRGQSLRAIEILAVDDGSVDGSGEWLMAQARREPRLRVFRQEAAGIATALNMALQAATAPFLARMDADDLCDPLRLELQLQALQQGPVRQVVSCRVRHPGGEGRAGYARHVDWINGILSPEAHRLNRFVDCPLAHPSASFSRTLTEELGAWRDGDFPEDYELWLRWMDAGVSFRKLPQTLLDWADPPTRLSRTHTAYRREAFDRVRAPWLARELEGTLKGRELWVWGAGRLSRRRLDPLWALGLRPAGYVDIDPAKTGQSITGIPVIQPERLPEAEKAFVLVNVGSHGARDLIARRLLAKGFREGRDWLAVAGMDSGTRRKR